MKPPQTLLDQIERFECPIVQAVLNVILNERGCLYLFEQEDMIGCTFDDIRGPQGNRQANRIAGALRALDQVVDILAKILSIDRQTTALFVTFEAGRRYEREKISLEDLERMMHVQGKEKEGNV